jgi:LysM repeat protein
LYLLFTGALVVLSILACNIPVSAPLGLEEVDSTSIIFISPETLTLQALYPPTHDPNSAVLTPTFDSPHVLPELRADTKYYTVQTNDTLRLIAQRFGVAVDVLAAVNALPNPDLLSVGQVLEIPPPMPATPAPDFKIIPDSELVYSPYTASFNSAEFITEQGGYLSTYTEVVDEQLLTGVQIVDRVARKYSINPRLLLALLEYQSGWVNTPTPPENTIMYPIGYEDPWREGLLYQLAWAADTLNRGFYLWQENGLAGLITTDGVLIPASPIINAGTVGVQYLFSDLYDETGWRRAVASDGFFSVYTDLFGYPFDFAYEPLLPPDLVQPELQLPFEEGVRWVFTGGPHGGWDNGSAWAALDFAPSTNPPGCLQSDEWVVAMADGLIIRAEDGAVIQDLDGDGYEQTGWTLLYMHIESRDRVAAGEYLNAGDRIGHPSCEGGYSTGTHVHIARRYNGVWIRADGMIPFSMDGWVAHGTGVLYDGYLQHGEKIIQPCECRDPEHMIER